MSVSAKLAAALVTVLLLVSSHWYVYNAGNRNGSNAVKVESQADTISRLDAEISILAQANIENEAKVLGFAFAAKQASKDHEKELRDVRATAERDADKRVRIDRAAFCGEDTVGAEGSQAGSDGQGTAGATFLPEQFTRNLRRLMAKADEVTADLRHMVRRADEAGCFQ
jgi:hypothetical protein